MLVNLGISMLCAAFLVTYMAGCAEIDIAKSPATTLSKGFTAKKTYAVPFDKMWKITRTVLDTENILVASTDKGEGRIVTDYIKGQQKMMIGLLGVAATTKRHKYTISLYQESSIIRVNVIAAVEVLEAQGSGWRPLGIESERKALEDWLYEKIEKAATGVETSTPVTQSLPAPSLKKETATAPTRPVPSSKAMTVQQVQKRLSELGYQPGSADGKMGKNTVEALKKYQRDNKLAMTGQADTDTIASLLQKSDAPAKPSTPQGKPSAETPQKPPPSKTGNVNEL